MSSIAVFLPELGGIGGAEILAVTQARMLREAGHDVTVVTYSCKTSTWRPRLGSLRLVSRHLALGDASTSRIPRGCDSTSLEWASRTLAGYDRVIAHNFPSNALLGLAAIDARKLWYAHEPPRWLHAVAANPGLYRAMKAGSKLRAVAEYRRELYLPWLRGRVLPTARSRRASDDSRAVGGLERIWTNSAFSRENVLRAYGERRVDVVHPLVDGVSPVVSRRGVDRSALRLLSVSRLEALKNFETVLRALAIVRARRLPGARLDVVGNGPERARLEALATSLGLGPDAVRFHGYVSDAAMAKLGAECDVFALAPCDEPFGMVFAEAALRGHVVIGPDHGGPREILDDGALGVTVDAFSPESVAEGFERVVAMSDDDVSALRARARDAAIARFGRAAIGARMAALLAELDLAK